MNSGADILAEIWKEYKRTVPTTLRRR